MKDIIWGIFSDGQPHQLQGIYATVALQSNENPQDDDFQHKIRTIIEGLHKSGYIKNVKCGVWQGLSSEEQAAIIFAKI